MVVESLSFAGVWLCTYVMHSTLLMAGVWSLDRSRCVRSANVLEVLWRVAVVGALLTTTYQNSGRELCGFGGPGYSFGQWIVAGRQVIQKTLPEANDRTSAKFADSGNASQMADPVFNKIANSTVVVHLPSKNVDGLPKSSSVRAEMPDLTYAYAERFALRATSVLALLWIVGAMMKTSRLVWLGLRARSELESRTVIDASKVSGIREVAAESGACSPTISVSDRIDGPISLPNGEIVFPDWVFDSLTAEHQQAIYAHELAHQVRRDPIWLLFLHLLNSVLWIQPLNRLARRRLGHLAELQADAWASQRLANTRILAESLYVCAERMVAPPRLAFGCSFSSKGNLVERVDCLLDGTAMAKPRYANSARWVAACTLMVAMFMMPGCNVDTEMAYRSGERVSVTKQGDGKMGEATIQRANLSVKLSHKGTLKLTAENDDVESLGNGGQFQLAESQSNEKRVYTVSADERGVIKRRYSLNSKEVPIDDEVQLWFAETLQRTVRDSGF